MSKGRIRVLALGIIRDGDRLFLSQGYDAVKQQAFYRALGGGVDFGETSEQALHREFKEELQAELTNVQYLGCLESIFTFQGKQGHEVIQLYQCDFVDRQFYKVEQLSFVEGNRKKAAMWVDISRFESGELILFPDGFMEYVR